MRFFSRRGLFLLLLLTLLLVSACGKESSSSEEKEIDVLLPPWTNISQDMLDEFHDETGISVKVQTLGWDEIHDKIVISAAAGIAPADVTEFDWSWVGQFGEAEWYEDLSSYISDDIWDDTPTKDIFKYDNKYLGMPYFNDFRVTYVNKKYFDEAGLDLPENMNDLLSAAEKMKADGIIEYPIGLPLSATEGAATPWYLLTKAYGGELFNENFEPTFISSDSAGYKAMEFIIKGYKEKEIIDSSAVGIKDTDVIENFKNGDYAVDLAGWSGNLSLYQNEEESKIAESIELISVPGVNGNSRTFGLVGGLGIPSQSKNKKEAAEFIKWLIQPEQTKRLYKEFGVLPNRNSVLKSLHEDGDLFGGEEILKIVPTVEPLFKQGTPPWYPEFSTDVATTINQMAKGSISIDEGLQHIADNVIKLQAE